MQPDSKTLLDLTLSLADAVERGETSECLRLLKQRGRFLADLAERYPDKAYPADLQEVLASVRHTDREIERRLSERRDELGKELLRLGTQKNREAETAPRHLDLQA